MDKDIIPEPHLYWKVTTQLVKKIDKVIIPSKGYLWRTITPVMSSSESRIKDIFWKATKPAAISLCDKGPKAKVNPPGPGSSKEWMVAFYNHSKDEVKLTVYALEDHVIGMVCIDEP